ncbi:MAG: DNA repair protein RecO [Muribaculaceae bacterium]|nr:DNA repair protein RecO [Muribaculaceae bacterium]
MLRAVKCIVLRTVRYNDKSSIVTVYSRELGRMSFVSPAGASREATRRRALLMPLSVIDCVADDRPGKELLTVRDISRSGGFDFSETPQKGVTALFIADFLNSTLNERQPDEAMFDFIVNAINRLGEISGTALANFHIAFMVNLQHYLGIFPDISTYRPGRVFDIVDGVYRTTAPLHGKYLDREEASFSVLFSRMTLRNMGLYRLNREQRNRAVDIILDFYSHHLGDLRDLQSLDVVRSLF